MPETEILKGSEQTAKPILWGLWADPHWRELIIKGGTLISLAFCAYVAANTGQSSTAYSQISKAIIGGSFGFFVPYTIASYPEIQQRNNIKSETQATYNLIGKTLNQLETEYQDKEHSIHSYISTVKKTADNALSLMPLNPKDKNQPPHLNTIKSVIESLNQRVSLFTSSLKANTVQEKELIAQELEFWQQDILKIKEALLKEAMVEPQKNSINLP
jgi:hypothetical protein